MSFLNKPVFPKDLPATRRESHRRIAFSGAHNFRDLGGYETINGAHVKWGSIYRSDALQKLSKRDIRALASLDLQRVIDFRSDFERRKNPDRLPKNHDLQLIALPIFDENSKLGKQMHDRIVAGELDGIDPEAILIDTYYQFVTEFTPQFRAYIHEVIAAAGQPLLFHCTAGKDRTGFAAAILLRILEVPETTILHDYLITQVNMQKAFAGAFLLVLFLRGKRTMRLLQKLSGAIPEYLHSAFAAIDEQYGSFEDYVSEGLELSDADVKTLRTTLLEP
jgi:protein-tyrosine phosphatase